MSAYRQRTFSRADWQLAQDEWRDGGFGSEWRDVRHQAAMGGIIFPPSGTALDSWEDDHPSQRAIIIRAIRETPRLLERCIAGASSWSQVIDRLTRSRDEWRERQREFDIRRAADEDVPTGREAARSLKRILEVISES